VNRFRGGLVFKAHRLVYHSTLGLIEINRERWNYFLVALTSSLFSFILFGGINSVFKAHRRVYHSTLGLRVIKRETSSLFSFVAFGAINSVM